MADDIVARALAALEGTIPGPWFWHGNTDHNGDVGLCGRIPGLGVVDVLRTCQERRTEESLGKEWDQDADLADYISREDYIADRMDGNPHRYLAFGREDAAFVEFGRDHAIYEVARNQGLPDDTPRDHPKVYRADVVGVRNANAQFIADARTLVPGLLAEIERLRGALGDAWDDGNACGLDGWTGPGRGAGEVDDEAIWRRDRCIEKLLRGVQ